MAEGKLMENVVGNDDTFVMAQEAIMETAIDATPPAEMMANGEQDEHFFEGVEKLLEIWFDPVQDADLRKVPRTMWDILLKSVRCEIISCARNDDVDAYVLSESSMFVSKRRWILKTCGTTVPLHCLRMLFKYARHIAGYETIAELFYSRKNFKRPEMQPPTHRTFAAEVAQLDGFFADGKAYCLGSMNRDSWYIYTASGAHIPAMKAGMEGGAGMEETVVVLPAMSGDDSSVDGESSNCSSTFNGNDVDEGESNDDDGEDDDCDEDVDVEDDDGELSCNSNDSGCGGLRGSEPEPDQTIEILMTELDPEIMALFTKSQCTDAATATKRSGIHKLLPGMKIDDYLFEPCGYSMNGISEKDGCYMTIHITPEPEYSYVSFETNVAATNYGDLIARVIKTFQPNKFVVTIFANKTSTAYAAARDLENVDTIGQWKRKDIQFCRFTSYDLTYAHYSKFPS